MKFLSLAIVAFAVGFLLGLVPFPVQSQVLTGVPAGSWMTLITTACKPVGSLEGGPQVQDCPEAVMVPFVDSAMCEALLATWEAKATEMGELYLQGMGVDTTVTPAPPFKGTCS